MEEFELVAKTFQGLEEILAKELIELGANNVQIGHRMVSFTGDKYMMYKANFCLHTAIRILKPIAHFEAHTADDVYEAVKSIDWTQYLDCDKTFAIDDTVYSTEFRHSKFVAYKVKDAIADFFTEKTGKRPFVHLNNPDLRLNIHVAETDCTLSLDSSGESLHRRGYRQEAMEAPINEVLAAGMIMMTGWHGECDLIDPMCGSGTIPIEAALIARNIAPGIFRKEYAFEKWADFDADMMAEIYNDDSQEHEFSHQIFGYDNNRQAIEIATRNVRAAGVTQNVTLQLQDFADFVQPYQESIIITNPPYGQRISSDNLLDLYAMIGERLKHQFVGNDAWILSYREECFDQIGLKPSQKISLFNGALECSFRQYQIFNGKYKTFRNEGNQLKDTDEPHADVEMGILPADNVPTENEAQFGQDDEKPFRRDERKPFRKFHDDGEKPFRRDERKPFRKFHDEGERPFRRNTRDHYGHDEERDARKDFRKGNDAPWHNDHAGKPHRNEHKERRNDSERRFLLRDDSKPGFQRPPRKERFGKPRTEKDYRRK